MTIACEQELFTFEQLSDEAKERAREWWREGESQDFGSDSEFFYESYLTAAKLLGLEISASRHGNPAIYWEMFVQGSGASFEGRWEFDPKCADAVRAEFPKDTDLHEIADRLMTLCMPLVVSYRLDGETGLPHSQITQGNGCHGVHEYTMDVDPYGADGEPLLDEAVEEFKKIMRDFARWIFKGIEAEYDYRMSDEAADEAITDNEYTFDEDGERAD